VLTLLFLFSYFMFNSTDRKTERSDKNHVHLNYVDIHSAGNYRCEISAEAPSFNTAAAEKVMQIYGKLIFFVKMTYMTNGLRDH